MQHSGLVHQFLLVAFEYLFPYGHVSHCLPAQVGHTVVSHLSWPVLKRLVAEKGGNQVGLEQKHSLGHWRRQLLAVVDFVDQTAAVSRFRWKCLAQVCTIAQQNAVKRHPLALCLVDWGWYLQLRQLRQHCWLLRLRQC